MSRDGHGTRTLSGVIRDLTSPLGSGLYFTPLIARYLRMRLD